MRGRVEDNAEQAGKARKNLKHDLREVCARRGLEIAYQPQVDMRARRVTGFEALLRWRHPAYGEIPPLEFVSLLKELQMTDEIGQWVIEQACLEAMQWPGGLNIAVNVAPAQLRDANFPALVAAALQNAGLAPARLELELTESEILPNDVKVFENLHRLRQLGVVMTIDDFGTGFASLSYLLKFPFDKIKIDRFFIAEMRRLERDNGRIRVIIGNIINLCDSLGLICLAEGAEHAEQVIWLLEMGCIYAQGYFYARPMAASMIPAFLHKMPADASASPVPGPPALPTNLLFSQILENANDIVIVTTAELASPGPRIIYVNPAFTRLTGYSAAEAIDATPRILQGPGTSRETLDKIVASLSAGKPAHHKILNYAKGGAPYWLDLHIVPLRDNLGEITHFAAIERDVTTDKRRLDELEYLADRDTLTGIPNRRAFLRAIEAEILTASGLPATAIRARGPCLALIDVDFFKNVNDECGHAVGDAVLYGIADRLAENIRRSDMLGRIGGEEFAVCMPAVDLVDAHALAERLRCAIASAPLETLAGPVDITVSIGVSCFKAGDSLATLMERADAAMYEAKRAGRDRVHGGLSLKF